MIVRGPSVAAHTALPLGFTLCLLEGSPTPCIPGSHPPGISRPEVGSWVECTPSVDVWQSPVRLIPGLRDAFLFMLSFKQSINKQPWPVCAALRASCILIFIGAQGRKGHREGNGLPSPQLSPPQRWWQDKKEGLLPLS